MATAVELQAALRELANEAVCLGKKGTPAIDASHGVRADQATNSGFTTKKQSHPDHPLVWHT